MRHDKYAVIGDLKVMKDMNIKPNFSELQRIHGIDRHTIRKYYEAGCVPERKKTNRRSKWDPFFDEIETLFQLPGVSKKGAYEQLNYKYDAQLPGNYNSFRSYALRKGLVCKKADTTPHVLYETEPGEQLQGDWKENLKTHLVDGTCIEYNVFSATLSYSREHIYVYSVGKTEEDFMRCLLTVYRRIGGITEKFKTDNMSAIVSVTSSKRKVHPRIASFFKDLGVKLELCQIRSPQTKGKCESSNRFINWIRAFDYKVKSEKELIYIIEEYISAQCNREINQTTKLPPVTLFQKEKSFLRPIGNKVLLENYIQDHKRQKVPPTLLITHSSKQYSVPSDYIGKVVDIYAVGSEIYIYHNSILITVHFLSKDNINYKNEHYVDALNRRLKTETDTIEELASKNLERLKRLGGD